MLYRASLTNYGLHFIYYLLNLTLPTVILPIFHFIALISQFLSSFPPSFSTFHKHVPQPTLFLHCNCKISTLVLQKKFHLQFHINDEDRDTNTTISFYMVLKHKNLTNEMHWTEIPSTYSVASLMLTTVSSQRASHPRPPDFHTELWGNFRGSSPWKYPRNFPAEIQEK